MTGSWLEERIPTPSGGDGDGASRHRRRLQHPHAGAAGCHHLRSTSSRQEVPTLDWAWQFKKVWKDPLSPRTDDNIPKYWFYMPVGDDEYMEILTWVFWEDARALIPATFTESIRSLFHARENEHPDPTPGDWIRAVREGQERHGLDGEPLFAYAYTRMARLAFRGLTTYRSTRVSSPYYERRRQAMGLQRAWQPWTKEEESRLARCVDARIPLEDILMIWQGQRTEGAIRSRIRRLYKNHPDALSAYEG